MPRTIVKTHAIVLRTMRMGETSSLVTLYAQECGKLKAMARGCPQAQEPIRCRARPDD